MRLLDRQAKIALAQVAVAGDNTAVRVFGPYITIRSASARLVPTGIWTV